LRFFAFSVFKQLSKLDLIYFFVPCFVYRNVKNAINGNKIIPLFFFFFVCIIFFFFLHFWSIEKNAFTLQKIPVLWFFKEKKKRWCPL
jgi:predicted permease